MRQEEFRKFLERYPTASLKPLNHRTVRDYISHCNVIEKAVGKDLDIVATNHSDINNAFCVADKKGARYSKALRYYLEFAGKTPLSAGSAKVSRHLNSPINPPQNPSEKDRPAVKPLTLPGTGSDAESNWVTYEKSVPVAEQVPGLCGYLEDIYGSILDFADGLFGEFIEPDISRIPVKLCFETPAKRYKESAEFVLERIRNRVAQSGALISKEDIEEILKNNPYTDRITGEFIHSEETDPYIKLYYRNVGGKTRGEYAAAMANVLAHEYIHYLEYVHCKNAGAEPFESKYLSEAAADFSALLYSVKRGGADDLAVTYRRYEAWKNRFGIGCAWPYAYAIFFYTANDKRMEYSDNFDDYIKHGSVEKLKKVFEHIFNCKIALDNLIHM